MASANYESNWAYTTDTVRQHYGPRDADDQFAGGAKTEGKKNELKAVVKVGERPGQSGVYGPLQASVPAGALVTGVQLRNPNPAVAVVGDPGNIVLIEDDNTTSPGTLVSLSTAAGINAGVNDQTLSIAPDEECWIKVASAITAGEFEIVVTYVK